MGAGDWARTVEWSSAPIWFTAFTAAQMTAGLGPTYVGDWESLDIEARWTTGGVTDLVTFQFYTDATLAQQIASRAWRSNLLETWSDRCPIFGPYLRIIASSSAGAPGFYSLKVLRLRGLSGAFPPSVVGALIQRTAIALLGGATDNIDASVLRSGPAVFTVAVPGGGTWHARLMARVSGADDFVVATLNSGASPLGGTVACMLPRQSLRLIITNTGGAPITYDASVIPET